MNRSLRIAIADDEPSMQAYLQETLLVLGHEVISTASTGQELVEHCRTLQPQLIIADIRMPDMDGLDAATAIYRNQPLPIIIISAYHDDPLIAKAQERHVLAYLVKPIKQADLPVAIALSMRRFEEFETLRQQTADLRQALEDRKLIERAKGVIMQKAALSEADAFHRLQRLASDKNHKLIEIARSILLAEEALAPGGARLIPIAVPSGGNAT